MKFFKTKTEFFEDIGTVWESFEISDYWCAFKGIEKAKYIYRDDNNVEFMVSETWADENGLLKKKTKKDDKK